MSENRNEAIPNEKVLLDNLGKIAFTLDKAYLSSLETDYDVVVYDQLHTSNNNNTIDFADNIRAVKVDRWMFSKEEKPADCLKNVLSAFADGEHNLALVIKRTPKGTEMFFVVQNQGAGKNEDSKNSLTLLDGAIRGSFQGTQTTVIDKSQMKEEFGFIDDDGKNPHFSSVAVLTNTPSDYAENHIGQGLEKLLNGIIPSEEKDSYAIVFLAESLSRTQVQDIVAGYEELASAIYPFLQYQFQMGDNTTETKGETRSVSNSESISSSVFKTHSLNIGLNSSVSKTFSAGITLFEFLNLGKSKTRQKGSGGGYGYSWGKSKTTTSGKTVSHGTSSSISVGSSQSSTYTYKSYLVSNLLERLEKTMKRLNESNAVGLWKYSAYVLAHDSAVSRNVANSLRAITQGKESFVEPAVIQEWTRSSENGVQPFDEILKSVSHFVHPIFATTDMVVTATSYVSTDQLANAIVFPKKSILGLPVLQGVAFGREPHSLTRLSNDLKIGCGYDMRQSFPKQDVLISKEELTKHTFITGSTGAGKSNTIYTLLQGLAKEDIHFLVIEPAKGEYKRVFGKRENVFCYGTNPVMADTKMLNINPFSFPPSTHVLEHMDRLVEIFNVCWPMYAAMPAILKDAVQRSYIEAGWDIVESRNKYGYLYPTFDDVLKEVREVLNTSDYSADNKGDYTGALVTRLRSLTTGINGQIFTTDSISDHDLFDRNVIVDLSRVGSTETKALIMGLLVLKMQEYRMAIPTPNAELSHITVLEEAHNLLRRTSIEQSADGANLLGKSVEMLANAIAEMRTYGEGFIIADQSPGLLDMSVIRNTNTKIIMRLPDFADRELVGKAAGLTDDQIAEISKLERGVAVVSQSDWLEPVLCLVDKYDETEHISETMGTPSKDSSKTEEDISKSELEVSLLEIIMNKELYRKGEKVDIEPYRESILKSRLPTAVKRDFLEYIVASPEESLPSFRRLVYDFLNASKAIDKSRDSSTIEEWVHLVVDELKPSIKGYSNQQIDLLMALIIYEQTIRDKSYANILCSYTEVFQAKGGVY